MSSASRREAMPGVRRYEDLFAWQLADQFKQEVSRLIELSQKASRNYAYRDQLLNAASDVSKDISEGFVRCSPLVFASFLNYALGSSWRPSVASRMACNEATLPVRTVVRRFEPAAAASRPLQAEVSRSDAQD
jgi:hypothetical protein